MIINKYDPRLKAHAELTAMFVCGKSILKELWESLASGKKDSLTNQSWIITGPRGAGKSHLLTKLYKDMKVDGELKARWFPIIFPEELYGVNSLFRLLIKVIEEIFKQSDNTKFVEKNKAEFQKLKRVHIAGTRKNKLGQLHDASKRLFDYLIQLHRELGKKFILLLENLQMLFTEQLTEDELKLMRSVMQEHPDVFIIIGTALSVIDQIEDYGKPFYHFFKIRRIEQLTKEGMVQFMNIAASYYNDAALYEKIKTNRPYIYTFRLLTGGNPRLILLLYELLRDSTCLSTELILEKIMELTPYFKDRTLEASPQKRIILEALAIGPPFQTATEIAEYLGEDPGSIMEQLKRLKIEGWINGVHLEGEGIRKKEVFYSLRDYFYRIWYKLRSGGIDEADVLCMAELVIILYTRDEIESKASCCGPEQGKKMLMYSKALELMEDKGYMKTIERLHKVSEGQIEQEVQELVDKGDECFGNENWDGLMEVGEKLITYNGNEETGYVSLGFASYYQNKYEQSIEYYKKIVETNKDDNFIWEKMGDSYSALENYEQAIVCYNKALKIKNDCHEAWYEMGWCYIQLEEYKEAIKCYKQVVKINAKFYEAWNDMGNTYAELNKYEQAIKCYENVVAINNEAILGWFNMGKSYDDLNNYEQAIECYKKATIIKKDYYEAWYNMGKCFYKNKGLKNYWQAYTAITNSIINTPHFDIFTYENIPIYTDIAATIFTPSQSLETFLSRETTTPDKLEALCQLLLLGKLSTVLKEVDVLLKAEDMDKKQLKKLFFYTEAYLLDLLKTDPESQTTGELLGFWLKICSVYFNEEDMKKVFQEFLIHYIKITGKEKISLEAVETLITRVKAEGIIVSDVLLAIVRSIKNPNSREAKTWSADPLFAEIVKLLSKDAAVASDKGDLKKE